MDNLQPLAPDNCIATNIQSLARQLRTEWESLPSDRDHTGTITEREANATRRQTLLVNHGPLLLAYRAWEEAHDRLYTESQRLNQLQACHDELTAQFAALPANHPAVSDLQHSLAVVLHGRDHDSGMMKMPLWNWMTAHHCTAMLNGGGLKNTQARVEALGEKVGATWHDLLHQQGHVERLVATARPS